MSDINKMRESFEAFAKREGMSLDMYKSSYLSDETYSAWITWQAAQSVPVGMRVSVDTSTGEHDAGNRVFAVVTGQQDDGRGGLILLCEEESRNFEQSVPVVGEPVAYGVPNSRPTESLPFMQVMLQIPPNAQYPELLVPLIIQPTHSITAAELERLRKDAELKASEASIGCEALQEIIDLLPGSSVEQAKLIAVAAMTKRAAIAAEGE